MEKDGIVKFTHSQLCDIGEKYLRNTMNCKVTAKELVSCNAEIPDVIGFKEAYSYLLEAKTSRADFFADKKKPFRIDDTEGMGNFRYFICEKGLIKIEDLPHKWGLIYVNEKGKARLIHGNQGNQYREDFLFTANIEAENSLMFSMLRRVVFNGYIKNGEWNYIKE